MTLISMLFGIAPIVMTNLILIRLGAVANGSLTSFTTISNHLNYWTAEIDERT
jgi:prolipoprotein diacylglyceryltransferase